MLIEDSIARIRPAVAHTAALRGGNLERLGPSLVLLLAQEACHLLGVLQAKRSKENI